MNALAQIDAQRGEQHSAQRVSPLPMLTFDLPLPPSANALFANVRGKGRVKTAEYKAWIEEARWHVLTAWRTQGKPEVGAQTPMRLSLRLGLVGRRRDAGNCLKAIEDILVRELPIPDDRYNDRIVILRDETIPNIARVTIGPLSASVPLFASAPDTG